MTCSGSHRDSGITVPTLTPCPPDVLHQRCGMAVEVSSWGRWLAGWDGCVSVCVALPVLGPSCQFLSLGLASTALSWTQGRDTSSMLSPAMAWCPLLSPHIHPGVATPAVHRDSSCIRLLTTTSALPLGGSCPRAKVLMSHLFPATTQSPQAEDTPAWSGIQSVASSLHCWPPGRQSGQQRLSLSWVFVAHNWTPFFLSLT